jgi:hypothetical protein
MPELSSQANAKSAIRDMEPKQIAWHQQAVGSCSRSALSLRYIRVVRSDLIGGVGDE